MMGRFVSFTPILFCFVFFGVLLLWHLGGGR